LGLGSNDSGHGNPLLDDESEPTVAVDETCCSAWDAVVLDASCEVVAVVVCEVFPAGVAVA
jgi:hypothetical protein